MKNTKNKCAKISFYLLILILAVIGFSMTACKDGVSSYNVTVIGGVGSGTYEEGTIVYITATTPSGQVFTNWTVNIGNIILASSTSSSTTFVMPDSDVVITANFAALSIDGIWVLGSAEVTVNGSTGIFTKYTNPSTLWKDAIDKKHIVIGTTPYWKSIASSGTLKWSGQTLKVTYNTSSPNVATGITYGSCTLTLSSNGQTLTESSSDSNGSFTNTWTRK